MGLAIYILQLCAVVGVLALALSIYLDGLGYLPFHIIATAGIGGYVYAILTTTTGFSPAGAAASAVLAASVVGLLCAEATRSLRSDGLTLASFGLAVAAFEIFRACNLGGGVFGTSNIPSLNFGGGAVGDIVASMALIAGASALTRYWRRSLGGKIAAAIRMDEWAAISIGVRIIAHQRISGLLAGGLAGAAGAYMVSKSGFIEPRDFQTTALLLPLAAAIGAGGRTPGGVILLSVGVVLASEAALFLSTSAEAAGPISEIVVALALVVTMVIIRLRQQRGLHA
jgi:branched-chain amino acid transport system permease protein